MTEATNLIYDYNPPVAQLLALGDIRGQARQDYLALGLSAAHIPDLVRMAQDDDLHWADSDSAEVWAPIHAWRALGQLGAVEAIEPLVAHLPRIDEVEDDWAMEEIPYALAGIGEAAVPALALFLADKRYGLWARVTAASSLGKIGEQHPPAREAAIAALVNGLKDYKTQAEELNGFIISYLVDLKAVEAAPLMEQVFAADKADISVQGDWEDVQIELGLLDKRLTPEPHYVWLTAAQIRAEERQKAQFKAQMHSRQQAKAKTKAKRKQAKQSRQKQRKKKK
jgi:hypothetical protein